DFVAVDMSYAAGTGVPFVWSELYGVYLTSIFVKLSEIDSVGASPPELSVYPLTSVFVSVNSMYVSSWSADVRTRCRLTSLPLPTVASWKKSGLVSSATFEIVTSLMLGAEASRFELDPVGEAMPRPTPHWTDWTSIHFSWPFAVTCPLMSPNFM